MSISTITGEPPSLEALRARPLLLASVNQSVQQQAAHIAAYQHRFIGRADLLAQLQHLTRTLDGGLVTLEGAAGSGVTSILAAFAAAHPCAFWFADADTRQGAPALAAQLIALHHLPVPLIPPALQSDPAALAQFLADIAAHASTQPVLLVIDTPAPTVQPYTPLSPMLPVTIPPGVLIIYGCTPGTLLPVEPVARVALPREGDELAADQRTLLKQIGCPPVWQEPVIAASRGNMFFMQLAYGLLKERQLALHQLQTSFDTLHQAWWDNQDEQARQMALLLAAAAEPMPGALWRTLLDFDPQVCLAVWHTIGIINWEDDTASLAHWLTRDYLERFQADALAQAHTSLAKLALLTLDMSGTSLHPRDTPGQPDTAPEMLAYLARQFARHAALGTLETRMEMLPMVAQRTWIRMQERRTNTLLDAAYDLAWEIQGAGESALPWRLARSAAVGGTVVSLARMLPPEATVEALNSAVETLGRDAGLKQIQAIVEQLPNVQSKGLLLRRLGEACHDLRMRTSAMRMLSQALDIEDQRLPASWREQRENLHATLAAAALDLGDVDTALKIGARINHSERRAAVETQVVHWLLYHDDTERAQSVARGIVHESLAAWAQAEVAVSLARAGDMQAAETLLAEMQSETACSWAHIELACNTAATDEEAARQRIEELPNPAQRDRGLAQLARAFALLDKDGDALDAAARIEDVAVRVSALLDLRLTLEGLVAMLALEQVTAVIGTLPHDVKVPLVSMLAAAYASLGRTDEALRIANDVADAEERSRALSRVAVAVAQYGNHEHGLAIARRLSDPDERDWTLDELVHVLADAGYWHTAREVVAEIDNPHQQAHTLADLSIAQARAGSPVAALQLANTITIAANEYARALTVIGPVLVAHNQNDIVLQLAQERDQSALTVSLPFQRLAPEQVSRYQAAVAAALAEHGNLIRAQKVLRDIRHPIDYARAATALARATLPHSRDRAFALLSSALRMALLGRDDAYRLLAYAVPLCADMGGATLLLDIAATLDEVDNW